MKKLKILVAAATLLMLNACVKEEDLTSECSKWQIEINNPEATVDFKDGYLIIDIPNPQTEKDVRLIQYQNDSYSSGKVGVYVQAIAFTVLPENTNSFSPHMKSSFAYQTQPNDPFVSLVTGGYGKRGYYNGEEIYTNLSGGAPGFYGDAEVLQFARSSSPNSTVNVSYISSAQKIYYLDFGINPVWSRSIPVTSMHIELDHIFFGDFVDDAPAPSTFTEETLGFKNDLFDCNSIQ